MRRQVERQALWIVTPVPQGTSNTSIASPTIPPLTTPPCVVLEADRPVHARRSGRPGGPSASLASTCGVAPQFERERPHPSQGSAPGLVSPGWHPRPGRTMYRRRPLETARNGSAPMACGPNVDQARPLAGAAALRIADLAWQGDPRRLPPTSGPAWAIALLGGALAGSGPGTSPYVGGLSVASGMVIPQRCTCSNRTRTVAGWPTWRSISLPYQAYPRDAFTLEAGQAASSSVAWS
jgi:hypothetical protein